MSISRRPSRRRRIPVPDDFPVELRDGEAAALLAAGPDALPRPAPAARGRAASRRARAPASTRAFRLYELPMRAMLTKVGPRLPLHGDASRSSRRPRRWRSSARRAEAKVLPVIQRLRELWEREWLPEIRDHIDALEAARPADRLASRQLVARLEDAWERIGRMWDLHMEIVLPGLHGDQRVRRALPRPLRRRGASTPTGCSQGLDNMTVEVGRDLWWLSRVALRSPEVVDVLEREAAADVPRAASQDTTAGRPSSPSSDIHLAAYGHRCATWGIDPPSFIEDPTPVIKVLKDYIGAREADSPVAEVERLAGEREAAIAEARERLHGYPAPVVAPVRGDARGRSGRPGPHRGPQLLDRLLRRGRRPPDRHGGRAAADRRRRASTRRPTSSC